MIVGPRLVSVAGPRLSAMCGRYAASADIDDLVEKVTRWQPEWLAFTSKDVATKAARALGHRRPGLGPAPWCLDKADVFVLPGTSGANQRRDYDGRVDRLSWWRDLASLVGRAP